jgi:maleate isomerase
MSPLKKLSIPHEFTELDHTPGVGLVAPFDFALDAECWRWMPQDTSLYVTRTPHIENTAVTVDLAREVSDDLSVGTAVRSLLAGKPASIAYACTSGSFVAGKAGEQHLQDVMLKSGAPAAVTTSGALIMALKHLQVKRIAVATPYNETLSDMLSYFLHDFGFEVVSNGYLDKEEGIARISYDAVRSLAKFVDRSDAEAIFFSCTNLRTFDIIEELETLLGKPVLSANQVTMWAALQKANLPLPNVTHRLFTDIPPAPIEVHANNQLIIENPFIEEPTV